MAASLWWACAAWAHIVCKALVSCTPVSLQGGAGPPSENGSVTLVGMPSMERRRGGPSSVVLPGGGGGSMARSSLYARSSVVGGGSASQSVLGGSPEQEGMFYQHSTPNGGECEGQGVSSNQCSLPDGGIMIDGAESRVDLSLKQRACLCRRNCKGARPTSAPHPLAKPSSHDMRATMDGVAIRVGLAVFHEGLACAEGIARGLTHSSSTQPQLEANPAGFKLCLKNLVMCDMKNVCHG
eukprot:1129717-Pelagomonas_calceolata.AAC.2